jgi:uncharacterized damage-inducible protein DinB
MIKDLRYPIGKFDKNIEIIAGLKQEYINEIAELPKKLKAAVENLSNEQLDTPYRPEGWTVRQTIHHIADSHLNSFVRFKLALTEDMPTIRPYFEDRWAELEDSDLPIEHSLKIIEGLHARWAYLLNEMTDEDFQKKTKSSRIGRMDFEQNAWALCMA